VDLPQADDVGPLRPPLARRPAFQVLAFIALATAAKVVLALLQEPDSIEAYHWLYAQYPAPGYYDHPGMIGWLIWLSTSLFGDSLLAIRLPTIAGGGLAVWLAFLAGRRMYDERTGRLAALLVGCVPLIARFSMEATPDAPLLLFWMASIWALSHAVSKDGSAWWLASGFFIGAAMDSKYTAVFLAAGVGLFLVFSPEHRKWLARKEPYLAAIVALAAFWPTVVWNAQNDWRSFAYQGVERLKVTDGFTLSHAVLFIRRQGALVTPFIVVWAWVAGAKVAARWKSAPWTDRLNACLGLPVLILFFGVAFLRSGRAHWPAPAYLALFLLSAAVVERGGRWGKRLHYGSLAILIAAGVAWPAYLATVPRERVKTWEIVAAEVRRHDPAFVIASDYHDAAQLSYHARPITAWDLTPTGRGGKSFREWWRPGLLAGKDAIVVTGKPHDPAVLEAIRRCFDSVDSPREVVTAPLGDRPRTYLLWTARSYRPPPGGPTSPDPDARNPSGHGSPVFVVRRAE
jgi:hypothetical protein